VNNPFRFSSLFVYDEMQTSPPVVESALELHLKHTHFRGLVLVPRHREVIPI
jgi:hypothetical protein